jgi:hypothetical protein
VLHQQGKRRQARRPHGSPVAIRSLPCRPALPGECAFRRIRLRDDGGRELHLRR